MLAATLRRLLTLAKAAGADDAWLHEAADELVAALLEIEDLRRAADPRKLRTTILARRVGEADAALRSAGVTERVPVLRSRFALSRSRVHALLKMSCESQDTSVVDSRHELSKPVRSGRTARRDTCK